MSILNFIKIYIFFSVSFLFSNCFFSQTTIVNYDFNSGTSYGTLSPITTTNITSSVSSSETWLTYAGISSGVNSYTVNSTAGNAIAMSNSSGSNSRYFQFQLGGSSLSNYLSYKIYLQSRRSTTGATTITLAYSTDGLTFTNFATTQLSGNNAFNENIFDLSSIAAINLQPNLYFRVLASGASGTGTLRIDNFQVQATLCSISGLTATSSSSVINSGNSATLTAIGATSYTWNTAQTTNNIIVSPTVSTTYSFIANHLGCVGTATILITVNPTPIAGNIPTNGLQGWWPFCGGANDLSGNSRHGTPLGATLTTDRFGNANSAYSLNGIANSIFVNNAFFDAGWNEFTISGWYYLNVLSNSNNGNLNHTLFNTSPHNGLGITSNWGGVPKHGLLAGNGTPASSWNVLPLISTTQTLTVGAWKHFVFTKSGTTYSFYIDGILDKITTGSTSVASYLYKMYFGNTDPNVTNEGVLGKIDDYGIWNRKLTQTEITTLYNGIPPCAIIEPTITLKKILDAGYYNTNGNNLNIAFEEEYLAQSLNYQIVNDLNQPVSGTLPVLSSVVGDNRFQINLSSISGLAVGNYYRIKITNSKNEVWYARFKYTL